MLSFHKVCECFDRFDRNLKLEIQVLSSQLRVETITEQQLVLVWAVAEIRNFVTALTGARRDPMSPGQLRLGKKNVNSNCNMTRGEISYSGSNRKTIKSRAHDKRKRGRADVQVS